MRSCRTGIHDKVTRMEEIFVGQHLLFPSHTLSEDSDSTHGKQTRARSGWPAQPQRAGPATMALTAESAVRCRRHW